MITVVKAQKIGRKLTSPCPFCGGPVFAIPCSDATPGDIPRGEVYLALVNNSDHFPDFCSVFCSFACNVRDIWVDGGDISSYSTGLSHPSCMSVNQLYEKLFKRLFSLISINRGFKI